MPTILFFINLISIKIYLVRSGICCLPDAPLWGFVTMSYPHNRKFATSFHELVINKWSKSLLPVLSKVGKRVLHNQFTSYLRSNDRLTKTQSDYRK